MHCYLEFVTTPSYDTPGTLVMLHFDDRRYLIGNLVEGTSRACAQRGVGLRKVDTVFLTGRLRWQNIGGLLGFTLGLADVKKAATEAQDTMAKSKIESIKKREERGELHRNSNLTDKFRGVNRSRDDSMHIHGAPNLNYAIATARRFVFRTGMPLSAIEYAGMTTSSPRSTSIPPSYTDEHIRVWALPVLPANAPPVSATKSSVSLKRSHDEADAVTNNETESYKKAKQVVENMFNSDWRYDKLYHKKLSEVQLPASIFVRDPTSGQLEQYRGPYPDDVFNFQDVDVLVREPWPAALTTDLPDSTPSYESLSYIICNHPQRGKFDPEKAEKLGVEMRLRSKLAKGEIVQNAHGQDIGPDMVLGPGRKGQGFAVIDIPTEDYINHLLQRPEWEDAEVIEGVIVMVWLLGPGLSQDARIKAFQQRFANVQHLVASSDDSPTKMPFVAAAKAVSRHNKLDSQAFPELKFAENGLHSKTADASADIMEDQRQEIVLPAQPGLKMTLEPKFEVDILQVVRDLDVAQLNSTTLAETSSLQDELAQLSQTLHEPIADLDAYANVEVITLGTGSSHPSIYRNVSGTLIRIPNCGSFLLDCGESTLAALKRMYSTADFHALMHDMKAIWISHMHADHHLGTTAVIKAWYEVVHNSEPNKSYKKPDVPALDNDGQRLAVISDIAMLSWLREFANVDDFGYSWLLPVQTVRIKPGESMRADPAPVAHKISTFVRDPQRSQTEQKVLQYLGLQSLDTCYVRHCRGAQAVSFTFKSGFKVSYSGDCRPSAEFVEIGKGSHVLLHEATFEDDMRGEALAKKHSTAGEALVVASQMKARVCVLTHFSQRYPKMPSIGVATGAGAGAGAEQTGLHSVLEQHDENDATDDGPADESLDVGIGEQKKDDDMTHDPWALEDTKKAKSGAISTNEVNRLLRENDVHVLVAFDYMRFKMSDVPRLEALQPVLRKLYDDLASRKDNGKNGATNGDESAGQPAENGGAPTQKQKKKAESKQRRVERAKEKEKALE